jgi:DNA replication protein DnaD
MKELKLRCKNWEKYQFYKKHNKNYSNEQPWFMMYGRKLLGERKFIELKPEERDFLVVGCWCIGSQDNGFLPSPKDIAFKMRIDVEQVNQYLKHLLQQGWLEEYDEEDYKQIMNEVHEQVEENQRENGLAKVKKESVHEEAHRLTKKMSMNNG